MNRSGITILGRCGVGLCWLVQAALGQIIESPLGTGGVLPPSVVFRGEGKFAEVGARAERENWRALPIGLRVRAAATALLGTRYENYTLEVDDRIESPVVNFLELDCWTFYETSLALARMVGEKRGPYQLRDLQRWIEVERYRNGKCTGHYLSRMHQLEEVFADNQRRGLLLNYTSRLPGAQPLRREIHEMTVQWKAYRYLKKNPDYLPMMAEIERRVSRLPVSYLPSGKIRDAERYLADGDICAIVGSGTEAYTTHVGLIFRIHGRAHFVHATSMRDKGRKVIVDGPLTDYVGSSSKHIGVILCRPLR